MGHERLMDELADTDDASRVVRVVSLPNPAGGADWTVTVPGSEIWRPMTLSANLALSAVVANRKPRLDVEVFGEVVGRYPLLVVWTASAAGRITWAPHLAASTSLAAADSVSTPIPDLVLPGGTTISTSTASLDVGDQWSNINIYVEVAYTFQLRKQGVLAARRQTEFLASTTEGT